MECGATTKASTTAGSVHVGASPSSKQRRIRPTTISSVPSVQTDSSTSENNAKPGKESSTEIASQSNEANHGNRAHETDKKVPRRVELITLSSFKSNPVQRTESDNNVTNTT